LLICPDFGATRWGRKIKKNPDNNKNNADRQRFQGGLAIANPPFDYLASIKAEHPPETPPETTLLPAIPAKRVQFLRKPLKSPFLRPANTEFHA
jgi:hypothetical protein